MTRAKRGIWRGTLADVIPTLKSPEAYLQGVLLRMFDCRREFGTSTAYVRAGVTINGVTNSYRIEPSEMTEPPLVFSAGHREAEAVDVNGVSWSAVVLDIAEVQKLMAHSAGDPLGTSLPKHRR